MKLMQAVFLVVAVHACMATGSTSDSTGVHDGYKIEQPGTITFTVGVRISGKVEKPQVMIFLPKEKTLYRKETLEKSYKEEIMKTLPFVPLTY